MIPRETSILLSLAFGSCGMAVGYLVGRESGFHLAALRLWPWFRHAEGCVRTHDLAQVRDTCACGLDQAMEGP